ncbi:hypothetical protein BB561_006220 [Smittium simulii]|uniref:Uncharacterized protein n=1 Tax=Smittium simulii TaxID=133385 RepID=A0A2T9Y5S4_9FUNG|nr:hypothetical protein BB561_006220 [Smittium simulii]
MIYLYAILPILIKNVFSYDEYGKVEKDLIIKAFTYEQQKLNPENKSKDRKIGFVAKGYRGPIEYTETAESYLDFYKQFMVFISDNQPGKSDIQNNYDIYVYPDLKHRLDAIKNEYKDRSINFKKIVDPPRKNVDLDIVSGMGQLSTVIFKKNIMSPENEKKICTVFEEIYEMRKKKSEEAASEIYIQHEMNKFLKEKHTMPREDDKTLNNIYLILNKVKNYKSNILGLLKSNIESIFGISTHKSELSDIIEPTKDKDKSDNKHKQVIKNYSDIVNLCKNKEYD